MSVSDIIHLFIFNNVQIIIECRCHNFRNSRVNDLPCLPHVHPLFENYNHTVGESSTLEKPLTNMKRFQIVRGFFFSVLMASSDVDQKYLGQFAKAVSNDNPFLSSMLYKVLGLSVILSKKLIRARRLRKLDPTRDTKSMQFYHHIIWLSREGLVMVEQYMLPMVADYVELKVLTYKLQASFYHIFVLFHNQSNLYPSAISGMAASTDVVDKGSIGSSPTFTNPLEGGTVRNPGSLPPGLTPIPIPKPSTSFLLPESDYIPMASTCFNKAAELAESLLSGSHPIRLSVKLEYAAYLYDCLHDGHSSRELAHQAILDVYSAQEGMEDDTFDDAAELVGILGKMMKRGLGSNITPASTPGNGRSGPPNPIQTTIYSHGGGPGPITSALVSGL